MTCILTYILVKNKAVQNAKSKNFFHNEIEGGIKSVLIYFTVRDTEYVFFLTKMNTT